VRGVAGSVRAALDDLVPDQVQVEFGLELALKTGKLISVLAEGGAAASIKVAVTWGRASARAEEISPASERAADAEAASG